MGIILGQRSGPDKEKIILKTLIPDGEKKSRGRGGKEAGIIFQVSFILFGVKIGPRDVETGTKQILK